MKVFLSWSKDLSHSVAEYFYDWLPGVIQECNELFMSTKIDAGDAWFEAIAKNLDTTDLGIVFITAENQDAVWLNFEAGAMLNKFERSGVCPVLVGLKKGDYRGPLKNLQLTELTDEVDVRKLLETINKRCEHPLPSSVLDKVHERTWPELEEQISNRITNHANAGHATHRVRPLDDKVDELLSLVRGLPSRNFQSFEDSITSELRRSPRKYDPGATSWNMRGSLDSESINRIIRVQQESSREERIAKFMSEYGSVYATVNESGDIVHVIDAFDLGDGEVEVLVSSGIHRKMQTLPLAEITLIPF